MNTPYCGSRTTMGHGETAICGEPYYVEIYQCERCKRRQLETELAAAQERIKALEGLECKSPTDCTSPTQCEGEGYCIIAGKKPNPSAPDAGQVVVPVGDLLDRNQAAVTDYVEGYVMEGDEGYYTPNETERALIMDAIQGLLADDDFVKTWADWRNAVAALRAAGSRHE